MDEVVGLRQFFYGQKIKAPQIARETGYSVHYVRNILNGGDIVTDRFRARIAQAFPGVESFLSSTTKGEASEGNGSGPAAATRANGNPAPGGGGEEAG